MRRVSLAIVLAGTLGTLTGATAQIYPSRPITMIVPFAAGGPNDTIGRILAERMRAPLGQPVIIENVVGANGTLGVGRAARAAPDGYTLSIGGFNSHVVNGAVYALAYDVLSDFEPVALLSSSGGGLIVARKAMPAHDLKGLIAWLKANPGTATAGIPGIGSSVQLSGILFQSMTGTRFQHVPLAGVGDLYPQSSLRWNAGVNNYMTYVMGDIPVGAYDSTRLSNIGLGHGAIDAGGGYTYFNPQAGQELSAVMGLTYNFTNPATNYQSGVDWHLDWGAPTTSVTRDCPDGGR
jgi:tripartite-type tricarboxylate transporter receptor subunit TctC